MYRTKRTVRPSGKQNALGKMQDKVILGVGERMKYVARGERQ